MVLHTKIKIYTYVKGKVKNEIAYWLIRLRTYHTYKKKCNIKFLVNFFTLEQ